MEPGRGEEVQGALVNDKEQIEVIRSSTVSGTFPRWKDGAAFRGGAAGFSALIPVCRALKCSSCSVLGGILQWN